MAQGVHLLKDTCLRVAGGVRTLPVSARDSFWKKMVPAMEPVILQGCNFGPASER